MKNYYNFGFSVSKDKGGAGFFVPSLPILTTPRANELGMFVQMKPKATGTARIEPSSISRTIYQPPLSRSVAMDAPKRAPKKGQ